MIKLLVFYLTVFGAQHVLASSCNPKFQHFPGVQQATAILSSLSSYYQNDQCSMHIRSCSDTNLDNAEVLAENPSWAGDISIVHSTGSEVYLPFHFLTNAKVSRFRPRRIKYWVEEGAQSWVYEYRDINELISRNSIYAVLLKFEWDGSSIETSNHLRVLVSVRKALEAELSSFECNFEFSQIR